jgi:Protein of unknown function (DUF1574)
MQQTSRATHWKRKGRNAVLVGSACFLTMQLGLALAIERAYPQFRDPEFGYRRNRLADRLTQARTKPFTAIMLGSSRTTVGFDAGIVERQLSRHLGQPAIAFNFGVTGAGPLTHLLNLKRLLKDGLRPDLVFVEILPPLLNGQPWNAESNRLQPERLWRDEVDLLIGYGCSPVLKKRWLTGWPTPWYEHRFAIMSRFVPAWLPYDMRLDWAIGIDDSGYAPRPKMRRTAEGEQFALEHMRQDYGTRLSKFVLGGQACRGLIELLDLCRQERVAVALVLMPEGSAFRALYSGSTWNQIEGFLGAAAERHHVPIINTRLWLPDSAFVDAHHMFQEGAEQFTTRFGTECVIPLVDRLLAKAGGGALIDDIRAKSGAVVRR